MNVPTNEISVNNLPEDSASLKAMLREVLAKLESVSADQQHEKRLAEQLRQRADDLYLENLRLQQELERYKKATYGPRADRLSMNQLAQMLLEFAEALEQKPINLEDLREAEPETEVRCRAPRDRQREELADRIHPGTFRTSRACTQKVCVPQLRTCRREPADRSSRQSRNSNRERLCRPRASGFHRDQQVRRLPEAR